jgi:hypothetical protein
MMECDKRYRIAVAGTGYAGLNMSTLLAQRNIIMWWLMVMAVSAVCEGLTDAEQRVYARDLFACY